MVAARSWALSPRYSAMDAALAAMAPRERRTIFGSPVLPDVDRRSARSGCGGGQAASRQPDRASAASRPSAPAFR